VGLATGLVDDHKRIRDWVSYTDPIVPDPKRRALYGRYYLRYRRLYDALRDELHALAGLSQEKTR